MQWTAALIRAHFTGRTAEISPCKVRNLPQNNRRISFVSTHWRPGRSLLEQQVAPCQRPKRIERTLPARSAHYIAKLGVFSPNLLPP